MKSSFITVIVESKNPEFLQNYPKETSMWSEWSRSIEVNYVTKDNKEILTKIHFPFDPSVSTHYYNYIDCNYFFSAMIFRKS